jgi:hypothetical protein
VVARRPDCGLRHIRCHVNIILHSVILNVPHNAASTRRVNGQHYVRCLYCGQYCGPMLPLVAQASKGSTYTPDFQAPKGRTYTLGVQARVYVHVLTSCRAKTRTTASSRRPETRSSAATLHRNRVQEEETSVEQEPVAEEGREPGSE